MATTNTAHVETPAEEDARLQAEAALREADIAWHVDRLENEGFGDGLHGTLELLMDPKIPYTEKDRRDAIVTVVLGMVALRDYERNKLS